MTDQIARALAALKKSRFRSRFKLTDKDRQYIQDKGIDTIRSHAMDFITSRLAPIDPKNDGKQTPMRGHPVFIAQHATATCCRGCLEKWHQIEKGRVLTNDEIGFVVDLVMGWIEGKIR
jgi:exodeoxyribonuclease V alpha subunit